MLGAKELETLARRKDRLVQENARLRAQCVHASVGLSHPVSKIERAVRTVKKFAPAAAALSVPLGMLFRKRSARTVGGGKLGMAISLGTLAYKFWKSRQRH